MEYALRILHQEQYDIGLSELKMAEISGMELSLAIQQSLSIPSKPSVVAFTCDRSQDTRQTCRQVGMDSVIHKPVTASQLGIFFDGFQRLVYVLSFVC